MYHQQTTRMEGVRENESQMRERERERPTEREGARERPCGCEIVIA